MNAGGEFEPHSIADFAVRFTRAGWSSESGGTRVSPVHALNRRDACSTNSKLSTPPRPGDSFLFVFLLKMFDAPTEKFDRSAMLQKLREQLHALRVQHDVGDGLEEV